MKAPVSVVIPCYNQGRFLADALHAIVSQSFPDWECLIIDDGSTDQTSLVANNWQQQDSRIKYFYKENGGLSSARNFGINAASGEFILTLDADDRYDSQFIEKALNILKNQNIGVVSSWGTRFRGDREFGVFQPTGGGLKEFLLFNCAVGTSMFRKICWEKAGGYDESMKSGYEDWEFYIRVCALGWEVFVIPEILFFYRQHTQSMLGTALKKHDKDIRQYIYDKHKNLYIDHFDACIAYFLTRIENEQKSSAKLKAGYDYQLGHFLLKPLRFLKKLLQF